MISGVVLGDMAKNLRGGYCHGLKKKSAPFIIGVAGGTASGKVRLTNSSLFNLTIPVGYPYDNYYSTGALQV